MTPEEIKAKPKQLDDTVAHADSVESAADEYWDDYESERYCWDCGGRGWKITCIDDLCHGNDECIHGDPPTPCWTCNKDGERFDDCF